MRIPISDKQFLGFFKGIGVAVRGFVAPRLATRRAKIVAGSSLLVVVVFLGIALRPQPSTVPIQGLILAIEAQDILDEKTGRPQCRVLVAVSDTTEMTLLLPPPVPEVGHFVPLQKNWRSDYVLDLEKWRLHGPS